MNYTPFFISIISAIALTIESFLSLIDKSLCPTTACKTVGTYLTVNETLVVGLGAVAFWVLTLFLYFAERYPKQIQTIPLFMLTIAIAIDSSLIGFQYFSIQQKCILCVSVALSLALVTITYSLRVRRYLLLTILVLVWISGFFIHSIYTLPTPQGAYNKMVFYSSQTKVEAIDSYPKYTLIFSMNCPHCLDVIDYLKRTPTFYDSFNFATIDKDQKSLMKISHFLREVPESQNPFSLLLDLKRNNDRKAIPINKLLKVSGVNTVQFLSNLAINSIPVVIVEPTHNEKQLFVGSEAIISYFEKNTLDKN